MSRSSNLFLSNKALILKAGGLISIHLILVINKYMTREDGDWLDREVNEKWEERHFKEQMNTLTGNCFTIQGPDTQKDLCCIW